MEAALRIRGIYATALTKLFIENGLTIVAPSNLVSERFRNYQKFEFQKPNDVEINDLANGHGIILKGETNQTNLVAEILGKNLFDAIFRIKRNHPAVIIEIEFPYSAKSKLDDIRNEVVPTVFNHHRLRLINSEFLDWIESKDLLNHAEKREDVSRDLENRLIWQTFNRGNKIGIDHVKLDGRTVFLSEGRIVDFQPSERKMILKRTAFSGRDRYDGLNIQKKMGDYAITEVKEGEWFYKHRYLRADGHLIGEYYNINTKIELYPDKIRYVDLEIDVVRWPDGSARIIDEQALNRQFELGCLGEGLMKMAKKTARELSRLISREVFR